jgi:hypothetical protein
VYRPTMLPGYGNGPGGRFGGAPEFGSLPGNDPRQSPESLGPPPPQHPPPPVAPPRGSFPQTQQGFFGAAPGSPISASIPSLSQNAGGALIPLGNGLHYDLMNDQVVGGQLVAQ